MVPGQENPNSGPLSQSQSRLVLGYGNSGRGVWGVYPPVRVRFRLLEHITVRVGLGLRVRVRVFLTKYIL